MNTKFPFQSLLGTFYTLQYPHDTKCIMLRWLQEIIARSAIAAVQRMIIQGCSQAANQPAGEIYRENEKHLCQVKKIAAVFAWMTTSKQQQLRDAATAPFFDSYVRTYLFVYITYNQLKTLLQLRTSLPQQLKKTTRISYLLDRYQLASIVIVSSYCSNLSE